MSTENDATGRRSTIYGRVEAREANDTVVFISEQDRRIRFRYIGKSQQYPSAAEYQCTQCPVKALMINAEFRIVDPCAGHDCSIGACHPQSATHNNDATTNVKSQQSPATTALASHSSRPAKNSPKVIAEATYDANGCVTWHSERYGVTLVFHSNKAEPGRRRYFRCNACRSKCDKYKASLKACGIKRRDLIVSGDNIVGCHPDDAGTTRGHLCQRPLLEEKLKAKEKEIAATSTTSIAAEVANARSEDANTVPQINAIGETSARPGNVRVRPLAKRSAALSAEPFEDKAFGKIHALKPDTLTEAEHRVWSSAPSIRKGPMRGRELIAYQSQKNKRRFKFVLAGPSSLDMHAFDYYCLDCWNSYGEDCRVTVQSSTQKFVITDPDLTSSGRHACMQASAAGPSGSSAVAKKSLSACPRLSPAVAEELLRGLATAEAESVRNGGPDVIPLVKSMEYFSKRYQAKLSFALINRGTKGQAYYVCVKCRTLHGKLKKLGYKQFGYTAIRAHHAVVVGGRFVNRSPDECGVKLFAGDTAERRHICQDDKLKKILDADGTSCEDPGEPSPKRMRDAIHGVPSDGAARTNIHTQGVKSSPTDTPLDNDPGRTPTDQRAGVQAELPSSRDSTLDRATTELASQATTTTKSDESNRQGNADLGPAADTSDESLQLIESTYSVSSTTQNFTGSRTDAPVDQVTAEQASREHEYHGLGPAGDALGGSLQYPENTFSVSSAAQYVVSSRKSASSATTTHLDVEEEQKPQRFAARRGAASVDDSNSPTPGTLMTDGARRFACRNGASGSRQCFGGLLVDVKPRNGHGLMDELDKFLQLAGSDDETDDDGTSRTSEKRVKREHADNNDVERRQEGPAARFNRFLQEFEFWDEYSNYSVDNIGKPRDFVQLPRVRKKWIQFDLRN